jgi:hypothetical protein
MKKVGFLALSLMVSSAFAQQGANYSLEMEKALYELQVGQDAKRFCSENLQRVKSTDVAGKQLVSSICTANYYNFNMLQKWGEEVYYIAMKNNKAPELYQNAIPIGPGGNNTLLALSTLKDKMFWTSIERYGTPNPQTKKVNKEQVTEKQYLFFKDLFNKITDTSRKNIKEPMPLHLDMNKFKKEELAKSESFKSYGQSLLDNKAEAKFLEESLKTVMQTYDNYKGYLNFIYDQKIDEIIEQPSKFKGKSFTILQCESMKVALGSKDYKLLSENAGFICK